MTLDALVTSLSTIAAVVLPVTGSWVWTTQTKLTEHSTILAERKASEDEWKQDLKDRLMRIEEKIDERR